MISPGMNDINTLILSDDEGGISAAANIIRSGGVVALPTETVYGLGADALNPSAVHRIFAAKGRPADNPLILHVNRAADIQPLVREMPEAARNLYAAFSPGPLTVIMKRSDIVPEVTCGGLDTVAVRIPSHPAARRLIQACGTPIAAPSGNISGKPSPTTAAHILRDMRGRIEAVIDGGACDVGLESTIVDVTCGTARILRPGAVTLEQVRRVCEGAYIHRHVDGQPALSPGVKYKHYAPDAPVVVVRGDIWDYVKRNADRYSKPGVICMGQPEHLENCNVMSQRDIVQYAHNLYALLRYFDDIGADVVFAQDIEDAALRDRLYRAADYNIQDV